jgi:hypothetical protein
MKNKSTFQLSFAGIFYVKVHLSTKFRDLFNVVEECNVHVFKILISVNIDKG